MLANVLWPLFAIIGLGYALGKWGLSSQPLARLTFWALSPALVFTSVYKSAVSLETFGLVFLFILLFSLAMWAGALAFGRFLGLDHRSRTGLALALIFSNCGNYGLPFLLFSLGQEAFDLGVVYLMSQLILLSTLGVLIASWGGRLSSKPFLEVLRTPLLYAMAGGLALREGGLAVPEYLLKPVAMLSQAAIPVLVLLLGVQLSQARLGRRLGELGLATALRLLGAPLLAWPLLSMLRVEGLLRTVLLLEASTPTAVNGLLLAAEYDRDPEFVSGIVLATTALSAVTMPLLLALALR